MRLLLTIVALVALIVSTSGCYASRITTPAEPSQRVIEKKWASGFLFGLAMPGAEEYAEQCEHGASVVETKLSFLNMVASNLTIGLYSPMSVSVTCAEAP